MDEQTFYNTITNSPEWKAWKKEQQKRLKLISKYKEAGKIYDMTETEENGWISPEHWESFLDFTLEERFKKQMKDFENTFFDKYRVWRGDK